MKLSQNNNEQKPSRSPWFNPLTAAGKNLLQAIGLHTLKPVIQKVTAVTQPSTRIVTTPCLTHAGKKITILSANLWHDWPRHRFQLERLERLVCLVEQEKVDVLLLQEVSRTRHLQVDHWLSQRLEMSAIYTRANGQKEAIGFEEGVAILSHFPLNSPRLQQLGNSKNSFVRRLALSADVTTPYGRLALFSVHLGLLPHHNTRQLAHLFSWVNLLAHNRSAVIGGDFNAHEETSQIRQAQQTWLDTFRHLHPHAEGITHELKAWGKILLSRRRLDYIFYKPQHPHWQIVEARHLDAPGGSHSDHRAVLLRLESRANTSGWRA